jgi:signal transduction histidine kinase
MELIMLAELGRLYGGVLHDLSTPLTALILHMHAMPAIKNDSLIEDVLTHIKKLIQLARNTQYQNVYSSISINELLQNTQGLLAHHALCSNVRIITYVEQHMFLYGKKLALQQILNNLVSNAIDAYHTCTTDHKTVTITATQTKTHIIITVHDKGCGISSKQMKMIFKPGYTTKSSGHGFGLLLTRQLVHFDFRGDIHIQSTPNAGTTFTVQLPKNSRRSEYSQKKHLHHPH